MIEALVSGGEAGVADWFQAAVEECIDDIEAATLIGTLAIANYHIGSSNPTIWLNWRVGIRLC